MPCHIVEPSFAICVGVEYYSLRFVQTYAACVDALARTKVVPTCCHICLAILPAARPLFLSSIQS
jgi:hypothetical protein